MNARKAWAAVDAGGWFGSEGWVGESRCWAGPRASRGGEEDANASAWRRSARGLVALTAGAVAPVPLPISPWCQRALLRPKPQMLRSRAAATAAAGVLLCIGRGRPRPCQRQPGRPPHLCPHTAHWPRCGRNRPGQGLQPGLCRKAQLRQVLLGAGAKRLFGFRASMAATRTLMGDRPGALQRAVRVSPSLMATTRQNMTVRHEQRRAGTNRGAME